MIKIQALTIACCGQTNLFITTWHTPPIAKEEKSVEAALGRGDRQFSQDQLGEDSPLKR